jgi:hypothetical protein
MRSSGTRRATVLQLDGVLERDDAGEGDVESEVERALGDLPGLGEAVHDSADVARVLLAHDGERVGAAARVWITSGLRVARAARMCRRSARAATRDRLEAVVVEPRLADRDDLGRGALATRSSTLGSSVSW